MPMTLYGRSLSCLPALGGSETEGRRVARWNIDKSRVTYPSYHP